MSDGVEIGIWLIGIGALLVCVQLLMTGPARGMSGTHMKGVKLRDRIAYAAGLSGAAGVGVGSLIVAIEAAPAASVMLIAGLGIAGVFVAALIVGPRLARFYSRIRFSASDDKAHATTPKQERKGEQPDQPLELAEATVGRLSTIAMGALQASLAGAFAAFTVATAAGNAVGSYRAVFVVAGAAAVVPSLFALIALLADAQHMRTLTRWSVLMLFLVIWLAAAAGLTTYLVSAWPS